MRELFGIIALVCFTTLISAECSAQNIRAKRSALAEQTMDGTMVRVIESSSVGSAVDRVEAKPRAKEIDGYRVVIFSDNSQYAGDKADMVYKTFVKNYPHINAYIVFESPYFKVSVGDCLSLEEASHLMSLLGNDYPEMFPKREKIKYTELANTRADKREAPDSIHKQ